MQFLSFHTQGWMLPASPQFLQGQRSKEDAVKQALAAGNMASSPGTVGLQCLWVKHLPLSGLRCAIFRSRGLCDLWKAAPLTPGSGCLDFPILGRRFKAPYTCSRRPYAPIQVLELQAAFEILKKQTTKPKPKPKSKNQNKNPAGGNGTEMFPKESV